MRRTLAWLVFSLASISMAAAATPRIAVDRTTYTFPDTAEGIAVVHTFILSNIGDQELVIANVRASCSCTTTQLAGDRLQPGQSVDLVAMVNTEGFGGHIKKAITVTSNDPGPYGDYKITLAFEGNVVDRQPYQIPVEYVFDNIALLLDVRDPVSYAAGHLVGAMNVPANDAATLAGTLPAGTLTIFYDQSGSSATQSAVTQALRSGGVAEVYALGGGLDLWQRSYGTARMTVGPDASWGSFLDVSGARAYSSSSSVQRYEISDLQSDYVLIDIRAAAAFAAGHLAGAVNLPEGSVSAFVDTLPRASKIVVYSADGADSDRAVYGLWMRGGRTQSLLGGFAEWQKQHGNYLIVSSAG